MEDNKNVETAPTENAGVDTQTVQAEEAKASVEKNGTEKMYSQSELNKIIEERVSRIKKQPSNEDTDLRKTVEELQAKLNKSERELAISKYTDLNPEFKEFVDFKVNSLVDEKTDYATALEKYMQGDGKKFLKETVQSTPNPDNTSSSANSDAVYIYEKYGKKI